MTTPSQKDRAAFPRPVRGVVIDDVNDPQDGMSLRDYFAGQAIQGFARELMYSQDHQDWYVRLAAKRAYALADAMMEFSQHTETAES